MSSFTKKAEEGLTAGLNQLASMLGAPPRYIGEIYRLK